ncbi:MAG: 30S ribosomal protein S9 [Gammaproteobacteria bacterium]|nr:30S ribosomal protein S9 [Gammaproteobacteria bacterium]
MPAPKKISQYNGTGRRKCSVARVYLRPGTGKIKVNHRTMEEYFPRESIWIQILLPLKVVDMLDKFDVIVNVRGGGLSGQAGAIQLGIARALVQYDETTGTLSTDENSFRIRLRSQPGGLLTRDARIVERKKVGLHKARRGVQFSKR